jgi:hypothetical protein
LTRPGRDSARDTVEAATPHACATSTMVGPVDARRPRSGDGFPVGDGSTIGTSQIGSLLPSQQGWQTNGNRLSGYRPKA